MHQFFLQVFTNKRHPFSILAKGFEYFVGFLKRILFEFAIKDFDFLWFGWLVLVCIWNFVWPEVPPIADVLVAVVLSLGVITIKNKNHGRDNQ